MYNYIIEALDTVTAWDLPDEALADAISDQAKLMAGIDPGDIQEDSADTL